MGGKTLYFGEIGDSSKTLTSYFERNGARPCTVTGQKFPRLADFTSKIHIFHKLFSLLKS